MRLSHGFNRARIKLATFGRRDAVLTAALTASGLAACGSTLAGESFDSMEMLDSSDVQAEIRHDRQLSRAVPTVAKIGAPSVVSIEIVDAAPYHGTRTPTSSASDEIPSVRTGQATGVVIDATGLVVTDSLLIDPETGS